MRRSVPCSGRPSPGARSKVRRAGRVWLSSVHSGLDATGRDSGTDFIVGMESERRRWHGDAIDSVER